MATYVKGNTVANATSYELIEKKTAGASAGETVTTEYSNAGYMLVSTGALTGASSTWIHSDFIQIDTLTDGDDGLCAKKFVGHSQVAAVAFYSAASEGSFVNAYIATNADCNNSGLTAAKVKELAGENAQYVVFSTDGSKATLEVTTSGASGGETTYNTLATASEINFNLSALSLSAGEHTLMVKAKADGYTDSDYSNEVVYTQT